MYYTGRAKFQNFLRKTKIPDGPEPGQGTRWTGTGAGHNPEHNLGLDAVRAKCMSHKEFARPDMRVAAIKKNLYKLGYAQIRREPLEKCVLHLRTKTTTAYGLPPRSINLFAR